jgi:short-subunit dehydrogenase
LINNAGFGTAGAFPSLDIERESQLVRVNVLALVRLTHAALPGMLERGSGAIINVSSLAGEVPSGYNATYGATKAFVTSFTRALYEELRESPVQIQCLLPGLTRTDWARNAGIDTSSTPDIAISEPAEVAAASLAALAKGEAVCVPGALNRVLAFAQRALPRRLMGRVTARATRGTLITPA